MPPHTTTPVAAPQSGSVAAPQGGGTAAAYRPMRVLDVRRLVDDVVEVTLAGPDDGEPGWEPGAHLEILTPAGPRQYSLCGPASEPTRRIAVLREPDGRGGSAWMHGLRAGEVLQTAGPRNHFALEPAGSYVFVAGGIGITPILAMVERAHAAGIPWRLHYGGRTRTSMAYLERLLGEHAHLVAVTPQDTDGHIDLCAAVDRIPADALVYACGPGPLLDAVEAELAGRGLTDRLRTERFSPRDTPSPTGDAPFEVELGDGGPTLSVPAGTSLLDVLTEAGVDVLSSCAEGTCGTCETPVLAGEVDHRDSILTPAERARHDVMFVCCSRAAPGCSRLVLDL